MKKTFYIVILLLFVGFQLSATIFTIINKAQSTRGKSLGVDPYWSTNPRGFWYLPLGGEEGKKTYNTWNHLLRAIYVQYPDGRCFKINLEDMNLSRLLTDVSIHIYDEGKAEFFIKSIKGKFFFAIQGDEYSCGGVHVFE